MAFGFKSIADSIKASRFRNFPEDGDGIIRKIAKFKSYTNNHVTEYDKFLITNVITSNFGV